MSGAAEEQMEEVWRRARSLLSSSGSAQDVKAEVQALASVPLPPAQKYRHLTAETMLRENTATLNHQEVLEALSRLLKALSILEKYGCNLSSPTRPRYWRSVKHNNPVFRTTVDAIKGGRAVLYLYGYTNQQADGLSFPDDVSEPEAEKVAEVTLEVMALRAEVDMLVKGSHPHPELYADVLPSLAAPPRPQPAQPRPQPAQPRPQPAQPRPQPAPKEVETTRLVSDAVVISEEPSAAATPPRSPEVPPRLNAPPAAPRGPASCCLCGGGSSLLCLSCDRQTFCAACDDLFHRHPSRASHKRDDIVEPQREACGICGVACVHAQCSTCVQRLCSNCDRLFHSHPDRKGHDRTAVAAAAKASSPSLSPWKCAHCTTVNETRAVLCSTCERPRLATAAAESCAASLPVSPSSEWRCRSCTVVNQGSSILCEVCERPRLATRPPLAAAAAPSDCKWVCQVCTFLNTKPSALCEMCNLPCTDPPSASPPQATPPPPIAAAAATEKPRPGEKPQPKPRVSMDLKRQNAMREDGLQLIQQIREAERRGMTPEEVYAALSVCGGDGGGVSSVNPCDWLTSELPHLLDEICAMAASVQLNYSSAEPGGVARPEGAGSEAGGVAKLSRAEAKLAWLEAAGDTEKAVKKLLRDRRTKMRELVSLGFQDVGQCEDALRQSGGQVKGALSLLQRPLLEPFHQRIWNQSTEPSIDPTHPDKQRLCRRLLALFDLPSWGRCELVLCLLQEEGGGYALEDVVQAVKESHDKDFIRRLLNNECPCCLDVLPRSKMQSLTSCQCSVCLECFRQHFTVAVRDKHIRDMVCPVCSEPDINEAHTLDSYFSTLDIQLRDCLESDVYDLFHKKLTEHALMKDPKFLWCCHCTSGFINDGDQLKVTCPSCRKSFCAQCKKPWEAQHQDVSCEQFQQWKRENDPEYQRQGLAGYLRDNGITCPQCRFQYSLSKGGCMHFSCSQCRYQFCSGCNNPYHKTVCRAAPCSINGLHAHHPRDCLFYLRDWEPPRLQELLQRSGVDFNTDPPNATQTDACGVMEQKDEAGTPVDSPCGNQTQPGQAGLCDKHYREYLVSLINVHSLDPALLYDLGELRRACERHQVASQRGEGEEDAAYCARLLKKLMEVPLGEKVPRNK